MELQIHLTFFFSSRRRHTRLQGDWSSDVCSSDLAREEEVDSPAMAFSIDTSPARQFVEHLSAGTTPAIWMWQVAVAATAVLLAWCLARALFHRIKPSGRWKFGEGDFERVAYPLLAYVFTVMGRAILARYQMVALLDILAAALVAWIVIRIAVYILGLVLPAGAF